MSKLPPSLKQAPQAIEAEKAILGTVILRAETLGHVLTILSPQDFYDQKNRRIFQSMKDLHTKGEGVDIITLTTQAPDDVVYLAGLSDTVPMGQSNLESYCALVKKSSQARQIVALCGDIADRCYETPNPIDIGNEFGGRFFQITGESATSSTAHLDQAAVQVVSNILARQQKGGGLRGVSSGFYELDFLTSGLVSSELIILAARPAMGKTALALNIAENLAKNGGRVLFFSLEMSKEQLIERLLASVGHIHSKAIREGHIDPEQQARLKQAGKILSSFDIVIDDSAGVSIDQIRAKAKMLHQQKALNCIIVDYLQLLKGSGGNREQEISSISRGLKMLAKELDCPVIALSQLNRNLESRTDKRPQLSDLRESGAIEQDADIIIFLYRDEVYCSDSPAKGKADILVSKNRSGSTGKMKLGFNGTLFRFFNL